MRGFPKTGWVWAALAALAPGATAAEASAEGEAFFTQRIEPIFREACYKCHSLAGHKSKGGLTLDTPEGLAYGGKSGPVLKAGAPAQSRLIAAVRSRDADRQMPPKGDRLADAQIAALIHWVKIGAPDPRGKAEP